MLQYLITDPKYYTNNPIIFKQVLTKALTTHKVDIACFRDKVSSNTNELAKVFVDTCSKFNIETILLNSNIDLSAKLGASGVHLTSSQFNSIQEAKDKGLFTVISCHSIEEILKAKEEGINMVTFSPIFHTPDKGTPQGCKILKQIVSQINIPIIALGGILTTKQILHIENTNAAGFASIRYFIK